METPAPILWSLGRLNPGPGAVWSLAAGSLRRRAARSLLTLLTIAAAAAFLMFLLASPPEPDPAERQAWNLMMALSLLVSAAGVLNTLLMAVTQRYREIGTLKCLGATDRFILRAVLLEAALLGLAGAAAGALAGLLFALAAGPGHGLPGGLAWKLPAVFAAGMLLTALGAAGPAWIASRMPPMDAMRGEK